MKRALIAVALLITSISIIIGAEPQTQSNLNRNQNERRIAEINRQLSFQIEIQNFPYAGWDIRQSMAVELNKLAQKLKKIIQAARKLRAYNRLKIIVIGYSDSDGPAWKKLRASKKRALSVINYLVQRGFEKKLFTARWRSDRELADKKKPKSGKNRRVIIAFEGITQAARGHRTGDPVIDRIMRLGFKNVKYFIKETNKQLIPGRNYVINTSKYGVVKVTGQVISILPGDKVFARVRGKETPISVNPDGTFEVNVVIYKGNNYITLIQRRSALQARRSDVIKVVSRLPKLVYQFQLVWDGYGDLDLMIKFKNKTIFYAKKDFNRMGFHVKLDVDNRFRYGPENIRLYRAPKGSKIKVYVNYYFNVPWKKRKYYYRLKNLGPINFKLYVIDGFGRTIKTIKGNFKKFNPTDEIRTTGKLVGTFIVP